MGQKDEEDDNSSSRRRYYYYGYGGDEEKDTEKDEFRVAANTRYRQVLLWANESEMEEVRSLLIKLGELPPPGGSGRTMRLIEASATPETLEYLHRLKRQWQAMSGNELVLPDAELFVDPLKDEESENADADSKEGDTDEDGDTEDNTEKKSNGEPADSTDDHVVPKPLETSSDKQVAEDVPARNRMTLVQTRSPSIPSLDEDEQSATKEQTFSSEEQLPSRSARAFTKQATETPPNRRTPAPPIEIRLDPAGNLVLSSSDTAALDAHETSCWKSSRPSDLTKSFVFATHRFPWSHSTWKTTLRKKTKKRTPLPIAFIVGTGTWMTRKTRAQPDWLVVGSCVSCQTPTPGPSS